MGELFRDDQLLDFAGRRRDRAEPPGCPPSSILHACSTTTLLQSRLPQGRPPSASPQRVGTAGRLR
jgi:hypothetical protein